MNQTSQASKARPRQRRSLRPTIGHVAEASGVAKTTVSAILNNRPHCYASAKTRERVKKAAAKLGYRPTPSARGLLGKSTGTIGLVVTGADNEVFARKMIGFETAATAAGYVPLIHTIRAEPDCEEQALRRLMDHYVDGIAIYPLERGPHDELRRLAEHGFPLVTMDGGDRLGVDLPISDVSPDYVQIGALQANHLMQIGRKRIGLITAEERCFVNDLKIEGFREALRAGGVELAAHIRLPLPMQTTQHWLVEEFEVLRNVLREQAAQVDAVAVTGDPMGLAVIRYATELGIRVPEDLAVVGTDGLSATSLGAIPMSTIAQEPDQYGRTAFELLSEQLGHADDRPAVRRIKTPVQLYARASTIGAPTPA